MKLALKPKPAKWEIQTKFLTAWENCWKDENGVPATFESHEAAAKELRDYHAACHLAIQDGDISHHCPDDYRITVVGK